MFKIGARYQNSNNTMLQIFIFYLLNVEHSFIFPVHFPWCLSACLAQLQTDSAALLNTEITPKLEHSSEIICVFAQVSHGHSQGMPAIFKRQKSSTQNAVNVDTSLHNTSSLAASQDSY